MREAYNINMTYFFNYQLKNLSNQSNSTARTHLYLLSLNPTPFTFKGSAAVPPLTGIMAGREGRAILPRLGILLKPNIKFYSTVSSDNGNQGVPRTGTSLTNNPKDFIISTQLMTNMSSELKTKGYLKAEAKYDKLLLNQPSSSSQSRLYLQKAGGAINNNSRSDLEVLSLTDKWKNRTFAKGKQIYLSKRVYRQNLSKAWNLNTSVLLVRKIGWTGETLNTLQHLPSRRVRSKPFARFPLGHQVTPLLPALTPLREIIGLEGRDNGVKIAVTNRLGGFKSEQEEVLHLSNKYKNLTRLSPYRKVTHMKWKEMWKTKYNLFRLLGTYQLDTSDKLLFSYLDEKRANINSKYTFNDFLASSQLISYSFNKNADKRDLNSLYKYLKSFFKSLSSLISVPKLEFSPSQVKIRLFYYVLPSLSKMKYHKKLYKFIRRSEMLYKEQMNRKRFKNIMNIFKLKLFIAKWKEDNYFIRIPNPISYFKGITVGPLNLNKVSPVFNSADLSKTTRNKSKLEALNLTKKEIFSNNLLFNVHSKPNESLAVQGHTQTHQPLLPALTPLRERIGLEGSGRRILIKEFLALKLTELTESKVLETRQPIIERENKLKLESVRTSYQALLRVSLNRDLTKLNLSANLNEATESTEETRNIQSLIQAESLNNFKNRQLPTMLSLNKLKLKYLIFMLEKMFKKTIILDLVRLKYPYHESNILAQVLGLSSKTKNFRKMMRRLLYTAIITNPTKMVRKQNFSIIPSYLSGIKVRLAGRLITQRVVPRFTVQSLQMGSLARGKINFTDSSRITLKNKRGAFSFTVTTSHIFEK